MITRRATLAGLAAGLTLPAFAKEPPSDISMAQDFDEMWETLAERYCYFGEKTTDWAAVRRVYRPLALAAPDWDAFALVMRGALGEVYDTHTNIRTAPDGTPRMPPFDLIVARAPDGVRVTAVQTDSAASAAGIAIGDIVTAVDGRSVDVAIRDAALRCLSRADPEADAFVINSVVAGGRSTPRRMTVRRDGAVRDLSLPLKQRDAVAEVSHRRLDNGIGLIAIRGFSDDAAIAAFDLGLAELRDAPALIVDVRDNGGGDTAVARPIMGRFITETRPYARMRRRAGAGLSAAWTEVVEPRGPFTYERPVVVLCNRWSGSMAEGFPMGMRGLGRARIVGTPMMRLGAAVFPLRLDRSGLELQYSAEPVYDVNDRPRWLLEPDVAVPDGADILAAGIAEARRLIAAR
ncbi:peptidase S41 [Sphingomonas suaedae]|uniref:Peptidase S41 n=1 Tax=Sphingomonas suaedae TaxID=2599297 RepID=A0A518REV9_9SPHN|nr:S41 family peptidase [Sphingomonas suaedae]QDX25985.1 peptidase S41 [Sphingomonas suaedae]